MDPTQSGFRKNRSTLDQLLKLEVKTGFKKKKKTVAIFLDVAKAYMMFVGEKEFYIK
jgi:hypothetical protein